MLWHEERSPFIPACCYHLSRAPEKPQASNMHRILILRAVCFLATAIALHPASNPQPPARAPPPPTKDSYDFSYSDASERRYAAEAQMRSRMRRVGKVAGPKIVLLGKPASGKGTLAPMLSCAYRSARVGLGSLLRARLRAESDATVRAALQSGKLLSDEDAMEIVAERLEREDAVEGGWLLDGFPRTAGQTRLLIDTLKPDAVIVLDRPDDLAVAFCLGRCEDSATGAMYHPRFAPPPEEVQHRLVWRTDDTAEVIKVRLEKFAEANDDVIETFQAAGVPVSIINNARSELETFSECCAFLDDIEESQRGAKARVQRKQKAMDDIAAPWRLMEATRRVATATADPRPPMTEATGGSATEEDIAAMCFVDETEEQCAARNGETKGLRAVVRRCNDYDPARYAPVLVDGEQVGFVAAQLLNKLRGPGLSTAVEVGPNPLPHVVRRREDDDDRDIEEQIADDDVSALAATLAPHATSCWEKTTVVQALVDALVADSELLLARPDQGTEVAFVPRAKLRDELQDVRALGAPLDSPPLLRIERAAVVSFGVPSYGCHVNGYTRKKDGSISIWLAKRALSKPTYPGLLDQIAAGGLPAKTSLIENAKKEAAEEASIPPEILDSNLRAAGCVSYRYAARRGLSTKTLAVFDLELPEDLVPINGDGEVDGFVQVPAEKCVEMLRSRLFEWKPNSALVMLDFAMRWGFIGADDPDYIAVSHDLRSYSASSRSSVAS